MRRISVLVLDSCLDGVMDVLGRLRSVQMTRVGEGVKEAPGERLMERYSDLLNNAYYLKDVLGIRDEESYKVHASEEFSEAYLGRLEENISKIREEATPVSKRLKELSDEKEALQSEELALNFLDRLDVDAKWLGTSDYLQVTAGFIDPQGLEELRLRMEETTGDHHMILSESIDDRILSIIVTLGDYRGEVESILRGFKFDALNLTGKGMGEIRGRLASIEEAVDNLRVELDKIRDKGLGDILVAGEIAQIGRKTQEMVLNFGKTSRVYSIEGWVPARGVDDLVRAVEDASGGCVVIQVRKPEPGENVPVSFNNPKIIKPFESIVEMFGLPSYTEIDPTVILAITFPVFFGLMFGDVGHGAVLALAGLGMILMKRGNESYWNFGMILLYCGIAAVILGFSYGSLFGNEEILSSLYRDMGVGHPVEVGHGEDAEELWVLWMSPPNQMVDMMGITLLFGAMHMGLGLVVSALNKLEEGCGTLLHTLPKLWFFFGEIAVIAAVFPFPIPFFVNLKDSMPLMDILLAGVVLPIVVMLLVEVKHAFHDSSLKTLLGVVGNTLFEIFETFSMFLSNTISYSRLLILAVVHASMMFAIYTIAGMEVLSGLVIVSPIIIVAGNIFVIGLEGLIVFIHALRLHFYEWFSKFYTSGGIKYTPFVIERKYTKLGC